MPLPCVVKKTAVQCHAKCKATQLQCRNPAAWGCSTCKYHGARRPHTILKGEAHPNYRHGESTLSAKEEHRAVRADLRRLERLMEKWGIGSGPKLRGRKS